MEESERVELYRRVLGLPATGATLDTVRRCHRQQMLRFHPDRGGSGERARLINEARDFLLSHPEHIEPAPSAKSLDTRRSEPDDTAVQASAPPLDLVVGALATLVRWLIVGYFVLLSLAIIGWIVAALLGI